MNLSFKLFSLLVLGVVCALMAAYSMAGVLQAGVLFTGERALRNYQVWGGATIVFVTCAVACFSGAWRLVRRQRAALAQYQRARRSYAEPAAPAPTRSDDQPR